jgi:hypothetical protein
MSLSSTTSVGASRRDNRLGRSGPRPFFAAHGQINCSASAEKRLSKPVRHAIPLETPLPAQNSQVWRAAVVPAEIVEESVGEALDLSACLCEAPSSLIGYLHQGRGNRSNRAPLDRIPKLLVKTRNPHLRPISAWNGKNGWQFTVSQSR